MDFKSVIITNDEYSISKSPCGSTETESKSKFVEPEEQEDGEILDNRCTTSGSLASIKDDSCMNSRESTGRDELAAQEMPSALDAIEGHAPQTRSMIKSSIKKKEGLDLHFPCLVIVTLFHFFNSKKELNAVVHGSMLRNFFFLKYILCN